MGGLMADNRKEAPAVQAQLHLLFAEARIAETRDGA
jgi:hypothetical protein